MRRLGQYNYYNIIRSSCDINAFDFCMSDFSVIIIVTYTYLVTINVITPYLL